jgi:hypothetical protein
MKKVVHFRPESVVHSSPKYSFNRSIMGWSFVEPHRNIEHIEGIYPYKRFYLNLPLAEEDFNSEKG